MAETTSNVEFAQQLHERSHGRRAGRREEWLEVIETVVLAVVAFMTAWSSYQAAKWDARSAMNYALATQKTIQAQQMATLAGQQAIHNATTLDMWIQARMDGNQKLMKFHERRFLPEFATAFKAWMALGGPDNPAAPPGPYGMPEYRSAAADESAALYKESQERFAEGVHSREHGDEYVRVTVLLATVLMLTALAQRFKVAGPRMGLLAVAFVLLSVGTYWVLVYPRA
jgi:hypothetical protein